MTDNKIKELRKFLGMTQTEFGNAIGKTLSTVQNWERGDTTPPKSALRVICDTFNVNERWLVEGSGKMFSRGRNGANGASAVNGSELTEITHRDYRPHKAAENMEELFGLIREYGTPNIIRQFIKKMQEIKKLHEEDL